MKNTGMVLTLGIAWTLVACTPAVTTKPVNTAKSPATSGDTEVSAAKQQAPVKKVARAADETKYLASIHGQIQHRWKQVMVNAQALLPSSHPANDRSRVTEIAVFLSDNGQLKRIRIHKTSGNNPFDNSALATMTRISKYPKLPARLQEGHVELRWRFHRDARACAPDHVSVVLHPLTPEEAFSRALSRQQWEVARRIMQQNPDRQTIVSILAEAGLSSKDAGLNVLALRIAPKQRVLALLENETAMPRWKRALDVLASRGGSAEIVEHLRWIARPRFNRSAQASAEEAQKIATILDVLTRMGAKAPASMVNGLVGRKDAAVVLAAAPMSTDAAALSSALKTFINDPKVAGPLAVYRLAQGPDSYAQAVAAKALAHKTGVNTLRALQRVPVRSLATNVEAMVRDNKTPVATRLEAIKAMAGLTDSPAAIFTAMSAPDTRVKVAAIRALGQFKTNTNGICYRLSAIGMKNRNEIGAEALASVARIGSDKFLPAMAYMTNRQRPAHKHIVIASYWGFGKVVVPMLNRLADHSDAKVREAARSSLDRIAGKAVTAAPVVKASPLGNLMQQVLILKEAAVINKAASVKKAAEPALAKSSVDSDE